MTGGPVAWAVDRPVAVTVAVFLVGLFGVLSLLGLPVQLTPDLSTPTLTVTTRWPGAAPQEIEREILEEQEEVLKSVQGLERMVGEATFDQGTLTLEFAVGADLGETLVRVSNRLTQVPRYPENADQPVVTTANAAGPPLAVLQIVALDRSDVGHWRTWAEDRVLPRLERISGVAGVRYFGGRPTEVEITFDPEALAARGVSYPALVNAVRAELGDISGGDLDLGKRRYAVRTLAAPREAEDLGRVVLRVGADGAVVHLSDVAEVRTTQGKRLAYVFGEDQEALAFLFDRETGANVLEVTRAIRAEVSALNQEVLAPVGLELRIVSDQVEYIEGALRLVRDNIALGGLLATLVLIAFLRDLRASLIIATAIPFCAVGTALGMNLLGRSVNVVSLAGLAFAVGMVVDNAIVVLENIDTWRKRGLGVREAALRGTQEVWGALVASTLTTVAVFLPILGWQGEAGELLLDVALAMALAVTLSLLASVVVIPSYSARFLGPALRAEDGERPLGWLARLVRGVSRRSWTAALMVAFTLGPLAALGASLVPAMEYLPTGNRNFLFGLTIPPQGTSIPEMISVGRAIQSQIAPCAKGDCADIPATGRSFYVARDGLGVMGASAADPGEIQALVAAYRRIQSRIPGMIGVADQASLFGREIGSARSIEVELTGPRLEALTQAGGILLGRIKERFPAAQVRPIPSLDLGGPELRLRPRRAEVARTGASGAEVGAVVDALVDGARIGDFGQEGEPQRDVVLRPRGGGLTDPRRLLAVPIATPTGEILPLGALVDLSEELGPTTIRRIERRRAVTLRVGAPEEIPLEAVLTALREEVLPAAQPLLPPGVEVRLAGGADLLGEAKARLGWTLLLATLICYLLLCALMEDFLAPLAVMITVPLAATGGVLALRLVDGLAGPQPLDLLTAMGFLILIGVVVNNAILITEVAVERCRAGSVVEQAVAEATQARLRPIAMSTLTSLAGLLPLVLFPGSGSELYRGVGAVVLGGLTLSTALTLIVVPVAFSLVWRLAGRAA